MISMYKLFSEMANVPNSQANGLTFPFGTINHSNRNKMVLMKLQGITLMNPDEQKRKIDKETNL
jgi:hypothetical protein